MVASGVSMNTLSQIYICKSEIESILQNIQSENRFLRSSVLCEKNMAASMRYDIESASADTLPLFGIDELKQ